MGSNPVDRQSYILVIAPTRPLADSREKLRKSLLGLAQDVSQRKIGYLFIQEGFSTETYRLRANPGCLPEVRATVARFGFTIVKTEPQQ